MRRYAAAAIAAPVLVVASSLPAAADSDTTVERSRVTFTLTSETCSHLSPGTVIEGKGTQRSVTTTWTGRDGAEVIRNNTQISGKAWDQDDNVYRFHYSNRFRVTETEPGLYSGRMTDHFRLTGAGPERLNNGFVALITTDFQTFTFDPIKSFGDPISFPDGAAHCDPL